MKNKAISPLIATVLLVAFVIAVGGIMSMWLTGFARTQTKQIGEQSETELNCVYGGILISNLKYCNSYLSGRIDNTRTITLKNITLQIIYQNTTQDKINFVNITLKPSEIYTFNISIPSNYDILKIMTECPTVSDTVNRGDISTIC